MLNYNQITRISGNPVLVEDNRFIVSIAQTPEEVAYAQKLRGQCFNCNNNSGMDCDEFDQLCAHLLVKERISGLTAGTCRLRSGRTVQRVEELYSAGEFEFSGIEPYLGELFEIGRSCVSMEFRSGTAAGLLWRGIAEIKRRENFRFMLGCASMPADDTKLPWSLFYNLKDNGRISRSVKALPRENYQLPAPQVIGNRNLKRELPPLIKGYLRIGAEICGPPAIDREFGTIDLPIWFDFAGLPDKYLNHYKLR